MAEFNGYEPGTPCWVDLGSTDPETSLAFYADLFGWDVRELGPELGGYAFFTLRDRMVAGVGPTEDEESSWTTCFAAADVDDVVARTEQGGGTALRPAFDVGDFGRMAMLADAEGAVFGVWQYGSGRGAEIANEPVSLSWNELATRDLESARRFYSDVLGWRVETQPMGDGRYTVGMVGDHGVVGMIEIDEKFPAGVPPHWLTYFAVDDVEATVRRAEELGGRVIVAPESIPTVGRFAVLSGPLGEAFAVIRNE
jgi:predicted enzyme related to lactoylglutathione lyase